MAGDKSKDLYRIPLNFSSGEQPVSVKLTALSVQADTAFSKVERMLGDLWGLNRPYTLITVNQGSLSEPWAKKGHATRSSYNADEAVDGQVPYRDPQIANLARVLGPASALNPRVLPSLQVAESVFTTASTSEAVDSGQYKAKLRFKPNSSSDTGGFSGTFTGSGFTQEDTTPYNLGTSHWHVDAQGVLYTGFRIPVGATVTYTYNTGDGDSYPGASFNVIPDPNQTANAFIVGDDAQKATQKGCTVTWQSSTSRLYVVLPTATHAQADFDDDDAALIAGQDPNHGSQLTLPDVLNGMSANDVIPEGFVYLYDNKDRTVIEGGLYYYNNQNSLYISNVDSLANEVGDTGATLLSGDTNTWRWSVITVGISVTQLVDHLRNKLYKHGHTGDDNSAKISHADLKDRFGAVDTALEAIATYDGNTATIPTRAGQVHFARAILDSSITGNDHPQYLHRYGYMGGGSDGNYDTKVHSLENVMLGDLVMGPVTDGSTLGYAWEHTTSLDAGSDSHSIFFGPAPVDPGDITEGGVRVYYDGNVINATRNNEVLGTWMQPYEHTYGQVYNGKGLHINRGNVYIGYSGTEYNKFTPIQQDTAVHMGVSEFSLLATCNDNASLGSGPSDDLTGYRNGVRIKGTHGSSIWIALRGTATSSPEVVGAVDDNHMQDSAGRTGNIILEASSSDNGMVAIQKTGGVDAAWPGHNTHGAAIIVSPGGGDGVGGDGESSLHNAAFEGFARWKDRGTENTLGANQGGFVHIVAGSDYHVIKSPGLTFGGLGEGYKESFQTDVSGSVEDHTPFGRIAIDSDRGIDLVVRTQKYLHEENYTSAGSAQGVTNLGGGGVANDTTGVYLLDADGNVAEVRFTTTLDYNDMQNTANWQPGANVHLMYGYGNSYIRHNASIDAEAIGGSGNPMMGDPDIELQNTKEHPTWNYKGGRNYAMSGIDAPDYGSNILGAGMVEAFRGMRNDPNQPPIFTYVFPFEFLYTGFTCYGTDSSGTNTWYGMRVNVSPYDDGVLSGTIKFPTHHSESGGFDSFGGVNDGDGVGWPLDSDGYPISWDQAIKWHDARLWKLTSCNDDYGIPYASMAGAELVLAGFALGSSDTSTDRLFDDDVTPGANFNSYWVGQKDLTHAGSPWIKPCSGPLPFQGVTGSEYNGDEDRVAGLRLFQDQVLSTKWWSWELGLDRSGGTLDAQHTNLVIDTDMAKYLSEEYYRYPLTLNLTFGSNPYNIKASNLGAGKDIVMPYAAETPSAVPQTADIDITATFSMSVYGRLLLHLIGDSPYTYTGVYNP